MADAVQYGLLENAVALELQDVDPLTAADYLTRIQLDPAPRAWRELIDRLRHMPDSPIAKALNSPLTLTLVRDTYRPCMCRKSHPPRWEKLFGFGGCRMSWLLSGGPLAAA
jgi:hypothetical protein